MSEFKVIKCGTLIDGTGADPLENVVIVIKGSTIISVGKSEETNIPANADIINALNRTVMPGMIDLHVHIGWRPDPSKPNDALSSMKWSPVMQALGAVKSLTRCLEAGFTTLRTMYTPPDMRRAVHMGLIRGPRLFTSGLTREASILSGADDHRRWVRKLIKEGADFVKIASTGGVTHNGAEGRLDQGGVRIGPASVKGTVEEHRAVAEEAHDKGLKVAVHAHGTEGIKRAVLAGVDTIEHGSQIDEESAKLMAEMGTYWVPTCSVCKGLSEDRGQPKGWIKHSDENNLYRAESWKWAKKYNVKIACGTDAAFIFVEHGENAMELELMTERGMSEMEVIVAATKTSAEALGYGDILGTIEHGKLADIIIIDGNPLEDIKILRNKEKIKTVIKDGEIEIDRDTNFFRYHTLSWI